MVSSRIHLRRLVNRLTLQTQRKMMLVLHLGQQASVGGLHVHEPAALDVEAEASSFHQPVIEPCSPTETLPRGTRGAALLSAAAGAAPSSASDEYLCREAAGERKEGRERGCCPMHRLMVQGAVQNHD
jgi:hypothetical protein